MARGPVGGSCSCHMHRWEAGHWVPVLREGWSWDSAAERLLRERKSFWKGVAGMISRNNGCSSVNITYKHTCTCAHRYIHTNTYTCNTCEHTYTPMHACTNTPASPTSNGLALVQGRLYSKGRPACSFLLSPFLRKSVLGKPFSLGLTSGTEDLSEVISFPGAEDQSFA